MPRIIKSAKGTFTTADITIDSSGRVVTAATGTAGGGVDVVRMHSFNGGASGNYSAPNNANNASIFVKGGGGGGGGGGNINSPNQGGGAGGSGGFGFYFEPVSGGTTYAFSVGSGGSGGSSFSSGTSGGASSVTNLATANGGNGGGSNPGNPASNGSSPGAVTDLTGSEVLYSDKGTPGSGAPKNSGNGSSGTPGFILLYDNTGT